MARPVILGNGALTVGLNEHGLVHDFYYPYVGQDNLTTARSTHHKIGVWVEGIFSWVDDGNWHIQIDTESDALVSEILMTHDELGIEIACQDFVDHELNVLFRNLTVRNNRDNEREIRVFMHQVFQISQGGRADTALFVPDDHYILDYKGRCSLLIYAQNALGEPFEQFAIGNYGIEGKEGTFRDAEDGELSGSAVEHGGVDSVLGFRGIIGGHDQATYSYWIVAAESQYAAERIHEKLLSQGASERLRATRQFWYEWLSVGANVMHGVDSKHLTLLKKSLMIIKAHCDKRGGVVASCDSSIYNYGRDYYSYVWPRDGAYAIWPLIRLGYKDEAKQFFDFCRDILTPEGYLMHKYQPDRTIGSTWHPLLHGNKKELAIQEDETASVLYMLGEYYEHTHDEDYVRNLYGTFIQPAANFMANFTDSQTSLPHASYDLWEMKFFTNTYTAAVTYQALLTASDFAELFDHPDDAHKWRTIAETFKSHSDIFYNPERTAYRKGYLLQADGSLQFENTLDASTLYGVMMYDFYSHPEKLHNTARAIEDRLLDTAPSGGLPRFENDGYFLAHEQYLGNPWIVTTLWMAQYYLRTKQRDKAEKYTEWVISHVLDGGALSEQVNPESGAPVSVTPLVWSHAELINTMLDMAVSG